jgi:hypothetical protein
VIPHVNLGTPSRNYLEDQAPRIDAQVTAYLKEHGYTVLPQREFTQHWNTAARAFGDPLDPTTGRVNMKTFAQIMQSVRDRFAETSDLDAFVFTDLVEFEVAVQQRPETPRPLGRRNATTLTAGSGHERQRGL